MLRMIIVDDEKIIRETICKIVDWDAMGIQIIGLCKNGLEAYDMILDEYPDIVLTDVQMPIMNGIDLAHTLNERYDWIQVMFLTGHDEFH
ncbi:MAG: response regulator, partial [Ruthenibacterium sp.]